MNRSSKLYIGHVSHKRLEPFVHSFRYAVFMAYVDLSEASDLVKQGWLYSNEHRALVEFRRSDYLGDPARPLSDEVRALIKNKTGVTHSGPIRMLTNLRVLGHVFNPATFYYCFDEADSQIEHIVLEITNTPWKERHAYVMSPDQNLSKKSDWYHYRIDKDFHVSPFLDMDYVYEMQFGKPEEKLVVSIANQRSGERKFYAALDLRQEEFTQGTLFTQLIKFPFITLKVVWGIYWQALLLKIKGARFFPHPGGLKSEMQKDSV